MEHHGRQQRCNLVGYVGQEQSLDGLASDARAKASPLWRGVVPRRRNGEREILLRSPSEYGLEAHLEDASWAAVV